MADPSSIHLGDPRHPEHDAWLLELGRATYAAARVAGICFDLARIVGGVDSADMYSDPLGTLVRRLRTIEQLELLDGLAQFVTEADLARADRNDLLHALPVLHGLHRRKSNDLGYVRNFYESSDLAAVSESLTSVAVHGNHLLHQDGGAAIRLWYEQQRN